MVVDGLPGEEVLALAAAVEPESEHPTAARGQPTTSVLSLRLSGSFIDTQYGATGGINGRSPVGLAVVMAVLPRQRRAVSLAWLRRSVADALVDLR